MRKFLFGWSAISTDIGLLAARIFFGLGMAYGHGWDKLVHFGDKADGFPEVFGMGSEISLALAVFSEFFCAILLALGFATRFALIPLIITMAVAVFDVHAGDPFNVMEKGTLYLGAYIALFFAGPGKISIDKLSSKR